jgi:ABC-2 type transport system ATP-binding protein
VALFGNVIHATVDKAESAIPAIRSALAGANIPVVNVTMVRPSLEDVFVSLIEVS